LNEKKYNYQKTNPVELIYILGAGHCGSTRTKKVNSIVYPHP